MDWIYTLLRSYPYALLGGLLVFLVLLGVLTFFQVARGLRYSKTKRALLSELEELSSELP